MEYLFLVILLFIVIIAGGTYFLYKKLLKIRPDEVFEVLTLEQLVEWFKKNFPAEKERYQNLQAILVDLQRNKEFQNFNKVEVDKNSRVFLQGFFDSNNKKLIKYRIIAAKKIDKDLSSLIEKNSLIVFK